MLFYIIGGAVVVGAMLFEINVLQRRIALKRGLMTPWQVFTASFRDDKGFAVSSAAEPHGCHASTLDELSADQIKELYQPPFLSKEAGAADRTASDELGATWLFAEKTKTIAPGSRGTQSKGAKSSSGSSVKSPRGKGAGSTESIQEDAAAGYNPDTAEARVTEDDGTAADAQIVDISDEPPPVESSGGSALSVGLGRLQIRRSGSRSPHSGSGGAIGRRTSADV